MNGTTAKMAMKSGRMVMDYDTVEADNAYAQYLSALQQYEAASLAVQTARDAVREAEFNVEVTIDTRLAAAEVMRAAGERYDDVQKYARCVCVVPGIPSVSIERSSCVVILCREDTIILVRDYGKPMAPTIKFVHTGAEWIEYTTKDYRVRARLRDVPDPGE